MAFLIGVIILIVFLIIIYIIAKRKIMNLYNNLSYLKKFTEDQKLMDEDIPKSLSSLDSLYLDQIEKDFPDLNINELKSESEKVILECFRAISHKNIKYVKSKNQKIIEFIENKITDMNTNNISLKNIKIHKTVISKYENRNGVATIYFQTAFQYDYKDGDTIFRIKQDRLTTEYIYIIDETKLSKKIKAVGINCPNCGAPITTLSHKKCSYCGSGVIDLVKRSFILNNIYN